MIQAHKKDMYLKFLEVTHANFLSDGRVIPHIGRYGGLIWNNFGFMVFDVQAEFPLSTGEG